MTAPSCDQKQFSCSDPAACFLGVSVVKIVKMKKAATILLCSSENQRRIKPEEEM
jgi:hypothetical protein